MVIVFKGDVGGLIWLGPGGKDRRRDTAGKRRLASGMLVLGLWQCRDRQALTLLLCQLKGLVGGMTGGYTVIFIEVD